MVLSDEGIREALKTGQIILKPQPEPDKYQTSAVDIVLGDSFKVWDLETLANTPGFKPELDLSEQKFGNTARKFSKDAVRQPDGCVILPPYRVVPQVMLCQTHEYLELNPESRIAARVEGRSSLARLGVMVHLTAPTIHAGFGGNITLELINHGPFYLKLVPLKTTICQFIFERLETPPKMTISTAFQGQTSPIGNVS